MNINQIKYLAAVVEHGSLSAAAKDRGVTVQAVSKAISELERELGHPLFARDSRGVNPTPFGRAFSDKARQVLAGFEELEALARSGGRSGRLDRLRLALNTPPFIGNETVRQNTAALIGAKLGIDVTMALATGSKGFEGLRDGLFDVLVTVGTFAHPDVECVSLGTVPPAVFMRKCHPLAQLATVSLADLAPYPVALSGWFDSANDTIVGGYRARGADLRFVEVDMENITEHLAADGVLFTTGIAALERAHPATALRLVAPDEAVPVPICVAFLKERTPSILATIEEVLAEGLLSLGSKILD